MKSGKSRIAVVVAFAVVASLPDTGTAANVKWGNDLNKAAVESEQTGKPMLITFTASWCTYCHKLINETFADQRVVSQINECFVPVILDADANEKAVELLGIEAFPSTVVISPELKVLGTITGFHRAAQMRQHLEQYCLTQQKKLQQAVVSNTGAKADAQPVAARMPAAETAFSGMCLVSMLDDRDLVRGSSTITIEHRGVKLHFASEKRLEAFRADPTRYWPLADGHCPVALARAEKETLGAASTAAVYRGQIVLFRSMSHHATFADDPRLFVESLERLQSASR
ncbi:MAG: thioredoxin family protein [Planctomycetota bacterium]|nr:thioredoxin family protein [Planctomycetota bacterium]